MMQFQVHGQLRDANSEGAAEALDAARQMLADCISEARRLIGRVRLPLLDESGVVTALQSLVCENQNQTGLQIEFHGSVQFDRLDPVLENAIYRIVQEALANAQRHSQGQRVRVELVQKDDELLIEVEDWGIGFDPSSVRETSFGLVGIRERARLLGGRATIDSTPGKGTRIAVSLPLTPAETNVPNAAG